MSNVTHRLDEISSLLLRLVPTRASVTQGPEGSQQIPGEILAGGYGRSGF
jgi:hypothetical protein